MFKLLVKYLYTVTSLSRIVLVIKPAVPKMLQKRKPLSLHCVICRHNKIMLMKRTAHGRIFVTVVPTIVVKVTHPSLRNTSKEIVMQQ